MHDKIYTIRGMQVMLDYDLAELYECANGTKAINLAAKRHASRFPERFMFQLTEDECKQLPKFSRFQPETLNKRGQNIKYLPYAFTEQGVAMLSAVLRTKVAEEVSVRIMDAFVAMRRYISYSMAEQKYINNMVLGHEDKINLLQRSLDSLNKKQKLTGIYFNGQIYDAYSKICEIFNSARNRLIIVDSYADKTILDIIKRLNIEVTIITRLKNLLTEQDICKYNQQYNNLEVIYNNAFHDRYFVLDNKKVYHCGASINRIGYKTFSINEISDLETCKILIDKIRSLSK